MNAALYVVATPIGNLDDISGRALGVLRRVDLVACEDTRKSKPMLRSFGIDAHCIAYHAHNEASMTGKLIERLRQGARIALISDAGTPAISDPGARLVEAVLQAGLCVTPIPGASAVTTLVSAAGLGDGRFHFEGFLPNRSRQRRDRIASIDAHDTAFVLFEAPHRVEETAADLLAVLGPDRIVVVGRELTKLFEQIVRLTLAEWPAWLAADANHRRGEFVLVVHPRTTARRDRIANATDIADAPPGDLDRKRGESRDMDTDADNANTDIDDTADSLAETEAAEGAPSAIGRRAMRVLCESMPPRQAAKIAARISGDKASALYDFRVAQRSRV